MNIFSISLRFDIALILCILFLFWYFESSLFYQVHWTWWILSFLGFFGKLEFFLFAIESLQGVKWLTLYYLVIVIGWTRSYFSRITCIYVYFYPQSRGFRLHNKHLLATFDTIQLRRRSQRELPLILKHKLLISLRNSRPFYIISEYGRKSILTIIGWFISRPKSMGLGKRKQVFGSGTIQAITINL
jgi:hypothetical protein